MLTKLTEIVNGRAGTRRAACGITSLLMTIHLAGLDKPVTELSLWHLLPMAAGLLAVVTWRVDVFQQKTKPVDEWEEPVWQAVVSPPTQAD